jgi:hypothetical protein
MPHITGKSLGFFKKASHYFIKTTIPLITSSKSIKIFEKTSDFKKKSLNFS